MNSTKTKKAKTSANAPQPPENLEMVPTKTKPVKVQLQAWISKEAKRNLNRIMESPGIGSQAKAIEMALECALAHLIEQKEIEA